MYKIHLNLKFFDYIYIKKFILQLNFIIKKLKINHFKVISIPAKKQKYTVLKSPHIDKKSREQFQWSRNKIQFQINCDELSQYQLFLYLVQNLSLPGLEVEISLSFLSYFSWKS